MCLYCCCLIRPGSGGQALVGDIGKAADIKELMELFEQKIYEPGGVNDIQCGFNWHFQGSAFQDQAFRRDVEDPPEHTILAQYVFADRPMNMSQIESPLRDLRFTVFSLQILRIFSFNDCQEEAVAIYQDWATSFMKAHPTGPIIHCIEFMPRQRETYSQPSLATKSLHGISHSFSFSWRRVDRKRKKTFWAEGARHWSTLGYTSSTTGCMA